MLKPYGCLLLFCLHFAPAPALAQDSLGPKTPKIEVRQDGSGTAITIIDADGWQATIDAVLKLRKDSTLSIDDLSALADTKPAAYRYELARRLCITDPQRGLRESMRANVESRYDAKRCVDSTAAAGITLTSEILFDFRDTACNSKDVMGPDNLFDAMHDLSTDPAIVKQRKSPWWICSHGMAAIQAGMENKTLAKDEWLVPEDQWLEIWDYLNGKPKQ